MVALKVPIAALFYIVHWAVKDPDAEPLTGPDGDGGVRPPHRRTVPRGPRRRGPHGAPGALPGPPRCRPPALVVRARSPHHG